MRNVPSSWEVRRLESLVDILDTLRVPVSAEERATRPGNVPYYGATGQVGTIDRAIFDEPLLLLGEDGVQFFEPHKPKCYSISGPAWVNNHAHVLRGRPEVIVQDFLGYFLNYFDYHGYANGTTRLKLTQSAMKSIPVPVPPLDEQRRIVEILDDHFSRLEAANASLQTSAFRVPSLRTAVLHSQFQPLFDELEQEQIQSLDELVRNGVIRLNRGQIISMKDVRESPGEYPIYSSASKNEGLFARYGQWMFEEESITWSIDGGGTLFHRPKHRYSVTNVGGILRIADFSILRYRYLFHVLSYLHSQTLFDWSRKAHPSVIRLVYDRIPVPAVDVQESIEVAVDAVASDLDAMAKQLDATGRRTEPLRRSLLHAAFNGQLTKEFHND